MKQIDWLVRVQSVPSVFRYCKKCGVKQEFKSSGCFRVNAQQKHLDVWLVYNCAACGTSWNLPALSRVNPRSILSAVLQGYHGNSEELAMQLALNTALIRRNGGEAGPPGIVVEGKDIALSQPVRLRLRPQYPIEIKAASVLQAKMGLSRGEFDRLCEQGIIRGAHGENLKRCSLYGEIMIEIG